MPSKPPPLRLVIVALLLIGATMVPAQPVNDDFADAIELPETMEGFIQGSNEDASKEPGEPDHAGHPGGSSLWYAWTAPASGAVRFETCSSTFRTLLAGYTGDSLAALTMVASRPFGMDCLLGGAIRFPVAAGTTYRIVVDGHDAQTGTIVLRWNYIETPGNDNLATAITLDGMRGMMEGTNTGATKQPGEPNHAGDPGGASVWYRWTAPQSGTVTFDTCSQTEFNTLLAVYTGSNTADLDLVRENDNDCGVQSALSFDAVGGRQYLIAVDGMRGATGHFTLTYLQYSQRYRQQLGLGDGPWNVAIAPDERSFATAGSRGAFVWDMESGDLLRAVSGHKDVVWDVAYSPDGTRLATGSWDGTAKLWDIGTGLEIGTFRGHTDQVWSVRFSSNGARLLTASDDGTARLWDVNNGAEARVFPLPFQERVASAAISPDGSHVVTVGREGTVRSWDAATGESIRLYLGHPVTVWSVVFSPDGTRFLTGSSDRTAKVWEFESPIAVATLSGHNGDVRSVAFSPIGNRILTGSADGTAKIWDANTLAEIHTLGGHPTAVNSIGFLPGGDRLATMAAGYFVRVWETETGTERRTYTGHSSWVDSIAFSPDGSRVLTGAYDTVARLWDVNTGTRIREFTGHTNRVTAVAYSPDGTRIITGSLDNSARLWDADTTAELHLFTDYANDDVIPGESVAFSPDGGAIAMASHGNSVVLRDAASGEEIRRFTGHEDIISSVAFSPGGDRLFTGSFDNTAKLWDIDTGEETLTLSRHTSQVNSVAFSPDGRLLLTGSLDGSAKLWDAGNGVELRTLPRHAPHVVNSSDFSPDGEHILTGSYDTTARLWDAATGGEISIFSGNTDWVTSVAFSPDGQSAITSSTDGSVLHWELNAPRAIILAGSGDYPGNPIAQQTQNLAAYAFRALKARGYTSNDILLLSAFGMELDADGNGLSDVDALLSLESFHEALTGPFAAEAGRLLVIMLGHGHRTGSFMTYRVSPNELLSTTRMKDWLDELQSNSPVDVTVLADFCYSGQLALDAALDDDSAILPRRRKIIASTTPNNEAVFLPAPDLTSFVYTFLSSAFMGNSFGESFRAGQRFFTSFPVAGQMPQLDPVTAASGDADRDFFGVSWIYGVQSTRDVNEFFPVFETVTPDQTIAPGGDVMLLAELKPGQFPENIAVAIRPPAPGVQSGEAVTGLPRLNLVRDETNPQLWTATAPGSLFEEAGPYVLSYTARFDSNRVSNPAFTSLTVSAGIDPDATPIRAILAIADAEDPNLRQTFQQLGSYTYSILLQRYRDSDNTHRPEWIDWVAPFPVGFSNGRNLKEREQDALTAFLSRRNRQGGGAGLLAAIAGQDTETGRLYVHVISDNARDGLLRFANTDIVTAAELDGALDAFQARSVVIGDGSIHPEVIVVIDGPGSGSFIEPLAPTGDQRRLVITSGRAGDGALFLPAPLLSSFTQRFVSIAWQGNDLLQSFMGARNFLGLFFNNYGEASAIEPRINSAPLARSLWLGRRWAFGAESDLPFVIAVAPDRTVALGDSSTAWIKLVTGVDPVRVYTQVIPPGLSLSDEPLTGLTETDLAWNPDAQRYEGIVQTSVLGSNRLVYWAEYEDGPATRLAEPAFGTLNVIQPESAGGWAVR